MNDDNSKIDGDSTQSTPAPLATSKAPGAFLILAIIAVPFIFAWFLLRPGYSSTARALGLGWAALFTSLMLTLPSPPEPGSPTPPTASAKQPAALADTDQPVEGSQDQADEGPVTGRVHRIRVPGEPTCTLTSETKDWEYIKGNAIRTADYYAVEHNPSAAFATADGDVHYQVDGPYKGKYTLIIKNDQIALAQLLPLFDFCTPASQLDDEGKLWKVVKAKLNGKEF